MTRTWEYHHARAEKLIAKAMKGTQEQAFPIMHKAAEQESLAFGRAYCAKEPGSPKVQELAISAMMLWLQAGRIDIANEFAHLVSMRCKQLPQSTVDAVLRLRKIGQEIEYLPCIITFPQGEEGEESTWVG